MNLTMLPMVNRIEGARQTVLRQIDAIADAKDPQLTVTIDGVRQDDAIVMLVRPMVLGELRGRLNSLNTDLRAMGVNVS